MSEAGSAAPSPLPLSPLPLSPDGGGKEEEEEVRSSPAKKKRRKWSFKKSKSQEELAEGEVATPSLHFSLHSPSLSFLTMIIFSWSTAAGLSPLIAEVKGETKRSQGRPRRQAPPPPVKV